MRPLPKKAYVGCESGGNNGAYTDEEVAFLKAIVKWRNVAKRSPTCVEVLEIAKAMGYRRVDPHHIALMSSN